MTLEEFLVQTQAEIRERMEANDASPYSEMIFTERGLSTWLRLA